jgi:uncharacterized membrane protein YiaA
MQDVQRLLQPFLAPAIFVSAAALLILSINVRLMGIVSRLRQFLRERHLATIDGRLQEAEAYGDQIRSVEARAEKIRKAFLFTLLCLAGTILTCLLLGLGLYWQGAQAIAMAVFVAAILCLLVGVIFYIAEMMVALSSVREEAKYLHLIGLGTLRSATEERRRADDAEGWQQ